MAVATPERVIETLTAETMYEAKAAAIDAQRRSHLAAKTNLSFRTSAHTKKIALVQNIVSRFFPTYKAIYVNHRENRGKPFTVVKVEAPFFPAVNQKDKEARYLKPLRDLGVEITFSKNSNSYLYRIYC